MTKKEKKFNSTVRSQAYLSSEHRTRAVICPETTLHSLAFEVVRKEGVVVGELGVPALACHTLWSDIHGAAVICALSLNTWRGYIDIHVLALRFKVWQSGGEKDEIMLKFFTVSMRGEKKEGMRKNLPEKERLWGGRGGRRGGGGRGREILIPWRMCHV